MAKKDDKNDKFICPCYKLTKEDIKQEIRDGIRSFKDLQTKTNIGKKCSSCKKKNKKRIKKYIEKINNEAVSN